MACVKVILGLDGGRAVTLVLGDRAAGSSCYFPGDVTLESKVLWNDPQWRKEMHDDLLRSILDG